MSELYLNVGCTTQPLKHFINVGETDFCDLKINILDGLPYSANSIAGIYCKDIIGQLPLEQSLALLREFRKVLNPGGILRLSVVNPTCEDGNSSDGTGKMSYFFDEGINDLVSQRLNNLNRLKQGGVFCGLKFDKKYDGGKSRRDIFKDIPGENKDDLIVEFQKPANKKNESEPLVSILIPAYNPKFFMESLQSALKQTYRNIEIVICDDSNGNEIEHIVNTITKNRNVYYYKNDIHLGGRNNYLKCFGLARGNYIKFLNDDDLLAEKCVEKMVPYLRDYPDVKLVTSYRKLIDENGNPIEDRLYNRPPVREDSYIEGTFFIRSVLNESNNIIGEPTTVMFRKSDMQDAHPSMVDFAGKKVKFNGDVAMWMNLLTKGDAVYLVDTLSYFRIHSQQRQQRADAHNLAIEAWKQLKHDARRLGFYQFSKSHAEKQYSTDSEKYPVVSIIIPVFNNLDYTHRCLKSIFQNTHYLNYEIIVVDNGSTDGTTDYLKSLVQKKENVKLITNDKNLGFAEANNEAAKLAKGKYLLCLNNDTEVQQNWLEPLIKIAEQDKQVAAVGSKLLFPNRTIQHAGISIINDKNLPDPLVARHIYYGANEYLPQANFLCIYQVLTAACLLIKKSAFEDVGGFDEGFWNGYEDVDLCFKLGQKGWFLVYQPESVVIHYESQSGKDRFNKVSENIERLHKKWLGKITADFIIEENGDVVTTDANKISKYNFQSGEKSDDSDEVLVSIIIPVYNKLNFTKRCIDSIYKNTNNEKIEIIIVDNNSTDGTKGYLSKLECEHSEVSIIYNRRNFGFAKANNLGVEKAIGKYIMCLNNDTEVQHGWLNSLLEIIEHDNSVAAVGSKLLFPNGNIQHVGVGIMLKNNKIEPWHLFYGREDGTGFSNICMEYQVLTAACLLIKKSDFLDVGGFSEDYWNGYEDVDFCFKLGQKKKRIVYQPQSVIIHYESQSGKERFIRQEENLNLLQEKWNTVIQPDYIITNNNELIQAKTGILKKYELNQFKHKYKEKPLISIIIPTFNQLEYTQKCIKSIEKFSNTGYEIIIVDNASTDNTIEITKKHKKIKTIKNSENKGFPKAVNQGLKIATGEYIVIANNDIIVTENWLERMLQIAESDSQIGIVAPISNSVSGVQLDKNAKYSSIKEMHKYAEKIRKDNKGKIYEFPRAAFLCTLIKRDVIEKIGGLDERFSPGNYEDDDFCLRAQLTRFKTVIAQDVFIHHYGSKSFKADGNEKYQKLLERNRQKFIDKWGATPDDIWLHNVNPQNTPLYLPLEGQQIQLVFELVMQAIKNERYNDADKYLDECLSLLNETDNSKINRNQIIELKEKISKMLFMKSDI